MKVLIVGGGGREHALGWRIARDGGNEVWSSPGNAGLARLGGVVEPEPQGIGELADWARANGVDYTIVGPEAPLVEGVVDEFIARGMRIFGPKRAGARLEGSKVFAKNLMRRHRIPTGEFEVFDNPLDAALHVEKKGAPIVIKADGLAAGKGVIVAKDVRQARDAIELIMDQRAFGAAGDRIVVEECLFGQEMSLLAFTDGETVKPLAPARDYKAAGDGDVGPNTGGMGCYSPVPLVDDDLLDEALNTILRPTVAALMSEGIRFRGVLYAGLILTDSGLKVLEYNARFGDPETQVQMPRLDTPLLEIMQACSEGRLNEVDVRWRSDAAVCVVLAAEGYPGSYCKGRPIAGLEAAEARPGAVVFHAGTAVREGAVVTSGGRVLGVTATGSTIPEARAQAYEAAGDIRFEGAWSRSDIASGVGGS